MPCNIANMVTYHVRIIYMQVAISDLAVVTVLGGLYSLAQTLGWVWLLKTYGMPYLVVNHWLVVITTLQHTHSELPHYDSSEWDWLRGALSTVDRSYGFLDVMFHHITDTHVLHHLFPKVPHYHAVEATAALKPILGRYYKSDARRVYQALWEDNDLCRYVAPDTTGSWIFWFRR